MEEVRLARICTADAGDISKGTNMSQEAPALKHVESTVTVKGTPPISFALYSIPLRFW